MSEVKRYMQYRGKMAEREGGKFILASDFDRVVKQMRDWLVFATDDSTGLHDSCDRDDLKKFLALLNEQPQEDKSHETNQP